MPKITEPSSPSTHRFLDFYKGEHYAFGRGLAVAAIHLPLALDVMHLDGWELMSVFGELDGAHTGFLFRRIS